MKKLLLLLLCVPLIFSCGEKEETVTKFEYWEIQKYFLSNYVMNSWGCKVGDCENGFGIYAMPSGDINEWKEILEAGEGYTYTGVGCRYIGPGYRGEYKDGKMHGQGTYTLSNGEKYMGEWKDDKMHGQIIYTTTDGKEYKGLFENGELIGK
jgi:hypothetical protein